MSVEQEVDLGLKFFKQVLEATGKLDLREAQRLADRRAFHIVLGSGSKQTDLILSFEFLSDLPATVKYQDSARTYAQCVAQRMQNPIPHGFYCKSGVPIRVEIEWPRQPVPMRAASFVHVPVEDLRTNSLAICSVIITHQNDVFDLNKDPFLCEAAIVNTVRRAVDAQKLAFYPRASHPAQLKELPLDPRLRPETREEAIDQFVAGKVYWMGFKQGDKRTKVWVADDWDADYLGTDRRSLIQTAQLLEAQRMLILDSTGEHASAGEGLLLQAKTFETGSALLVKAQDSLREEASAAQEWDVFICHASEDKDDFVRPLAEELRRRGLKVWYDEFTLKVGDSLRRAIDRGLQYSRYGIVVLSPAFFAKEWPQRELDGLVAKEVGLKKVILPVWHNVTAADVRKYSLTLADKVAVNSSQGLVAIVEKLFEAIRE